jgi:polyphosphate kinase
MSEKYISSELSWLSFNQCVLDEADDSSNTLYERIKFLAIFSSNLDEFFRVKVHRLTSRFKVKKHQLLATLLDEINIQQQQFGAIWKNKIIPELKENGIIVYDDLPLETIHKKEIERYFRSEILSYIQVVFIREDSKLPYFLNNRELYFLVKLKSTDESFTYAYINIPSNKLNRFKQLQNLNNKHYIISLDEIIRICLPLIFTQNEIVSCFAIKINRDEDFDIEDEDKGNLVHKIIDKVKERKSGTPTRFLYDQGMPKKDLKFCRKIFNLKKRELIAGGKSHNLFDLFGFPNPKSPLLQNKTLPSLYKKAFENSSSIFEVVKQKNQLLHFPYHSYHYVLAFFNEAAIDVRVKEIKVTLYRISSQSLIANALISAAKNGKKVTVFVEIKARFDENNNLYWSTEMKKAGIKIIYSIPNLKVHAKIALVTMQIGRNKKQEFAYMATGNFNENTAEIYADHGFFTANPLYINDVKKVFQFLKTKKPTLKTKNLLVAGFEMKSQIIELINHEITNNKAGKPSGIFLKVNGIDENDIINKLYEASQAGVKTTIIARGICTLRPGIENLSENIKVYRIVDLFLEHARVYIFNNNNNEKIYLSSADMMSRNLNRRIEVAFPILDKDYKQEIKQIIRYQLEDDTKKRVIDSHGKNIIEKLKGKNRAQMDIYNWIKNQSNEVD